MNTSDSNSGGGERNIAAVIQNDPSRCQFLDISKLPVPSDIKFPQSYRGPYVVLQKGAMPGDMYSKPLDFLLTREGRWLPMFAFVKLPDQERFDLCVFSTAAEAMQHLEKLVGRARIDEQRVARARAAEQQSTRPKKLGTSDPCSRASDATLSQGQE
jgi:hypothetical protein